MAIKGNENGHNYKFVDIDEEGVGIYECTNCGCQKRTRKRNKKSNNEPVITRVFEMNGLSTQEEPICSSFDKNQK